MCHLLKKGAVSRPLCSMLQNVLVICRELVAYRILVIKPLLFHIGIEVDLVYAMLDVYKRQIRPLSKVRIQSTKRAILAAICVPSSWRIRFSSA